MGEGPASECPFLRVGDPWPLREPFSRGSSNPVHCSLPALRDPDVRLPGNPRRARGQAIPRFALPGSNVRRLHRHEGQGPRTRKLARSARRLATRIDELGPPSEFTGDLRGKGLVEGRRTRPEAVQDHLHYLDPRVDPLRQAPAPRTESSASSQPRAARKDQQAEGKRRRKARAEGRLKARSPSFHQDIWLLTRCRGFIDP